MQVILIKFFPSLNSSHISSSLPKQLHVLILSKTNKTKVNIKHTAIKNLHTQHTHTITKVKIKEKNKNKNKSHGAYFVLVNYSWTWDLPWCMVDRPSVPPFQTTYFSIPRSYHLKITVCLGVEFCVHLFFSMLVVLLLLFCFVLFDLNLYRYF